MAVSLVKGGNVSLTKAAPTMSKVLIGLGWKPRKTDGTDFDLDASVFMVNADGKVLNDQAFVFFNNQTSLCGSVKHLGDNRTGEGEGDDEQITVELAKVPAEAQKLIFAVTIHEADVRKQNFGMVEGANIRTENNDDHVEISRFDLSEDASTETAMVFGELYRNGAEWKFKAVGQGYAGGLAALATQYGVSL